MTQNQNPSPKLIALPALAEEQVESPHHRKTAEPGVCAFARRKARGSARRRAAIHRIAEAIAATENVKAPRRRVA